MPRHFLIARHAHAEWPAYIGRDIDRPLTPLGLEQAAATGREIRSAGHTPARILASAALRTHQTAQSIARELGLSDAHIETRRDLYDASAVELHEALVATPEMELTLLVAHNPGISDLARMLLGNPLAPPFSPAQWLHVTTRD